MYGFIVSSLPKISAIPISKVTNLDNLNGLYKILENILKVIITGFDYLVIKIDDKFKTEILETVHNMLQPQLDKIMKQIQAQEDLLINITENLSSLSPDKSNSLIVFFTFLFLNTIYRSNKFTFTV